jgi:Zn-finger nucleic acid-binding protein
MKCPVCSAVLERQLRARFPIRHCPQCDGHLVTRDRLATIKRPGNLSIEQLKQEMLASTGVDTLTPLRCPSCRNKMEKQHQPPPADFHIDYCRECEWYWFDGGELAAYSLQYQISDQSREAEELRRRHEQMSPERRQALEENIQNAPQDFDLGDGFP